MHNCAILLTARISLPYEFSEAEQEAGREMYEYLMNNISFCII